MQSTLWGSDNQILLIEGGYTLRGEVTVSGAKNAVLPLMAAALLSEKDVVLDRVPELADTRTMVRLLSGLGVEVYSNEGSYTLNAGKVDGRVAEYPLVKRMRASILVLGPLLARFGEARVALPGGCSIGPRPINLHLRGLKALGATVHVENGEVVAKASRLRGNRIVLDIASVGATENLLMAAACADGTTEIVNAAQEPEVQALCDLLQAMGCRIGGLGSGRLLIEGMTSTQPVRQITVADRIEAGTWLFAVAAAGGDVLIHGASADHLDVPIELLRHCGARVEAEGNGLRIEAHGRPRAGELRTYPYPGFPTDLQSQAMALLTRADGVSRVTESVFENRFQHAAEMNRLGARISVDGSTANITGVDHLEGAPVEATDLRAGAGLVVAALAARGTTRVEGLIHLDRGYEKLVEKLAGLGARVQRVDVGEEL